MPISRACLNFSSVAGGLLGGVGVFVWMVGLILCCFFNVEVILSGRSVWHKPETARCCYLSSYRSTNGAPAVGILSGLGFCQVWVSSLLPYFQGFVTWPWKVSPGWGSTSVGPAGLGLGVLLGLWFLICLWVQNRESCLFFKKEHREDTDFRHHLVLNGSFKKWHLEANGSCTGAFKYILREKAE